jgi:serine/threonine protein phosphatase 1
MLALIEKARTEHPDCKLIFLGDLIDRGSRSREVVEYAITNSVPTLYGNHEDLCLAYSEHVKQGYKAKCPQYYDRDVWLYNGGEDALESWGGTVPTYVLDWMSKLPPYIILNEEGSDRKTLLSHSGYGLSADTGHWISALWGRYPDDGEFPKDGFLRVFGHTRNHEAQRGEVWINLDTGCAYKRYEMLTGLLYPAMELITQKNVD